MKRPYPFHSFLFAVFPVLMLAAHNARQCHWSRVFDVLAPVSLLAALIMLVVYRAFRGSPKSFVLLSTALLGFGLYGTVFDSICMLGFHSRNVILLPSCVLAVIAALVLLHRSRIDFVNLAAVLNVVAIVLVAPNVWVIASAFGGGPSGPSAFRARLLGLKASSTERPDIYYVILDGYGSQGALKENYGFDNREFVAFLRSKGFYVADDSRSNYSFTAASLASSLNMDFLQTGENPLEERPDVKAEGLSPVIADNLVMANLRAVGYRIVQLGSRWDGTLSNPRADVNGIYEAGNEFLSVFIDQTMLRPFTGRILASGIQKNDLRKFEDLAAMPRKPGPKFVFAHFILPHPPYLFGADGQLATRINPNLADGWADRKGYVDQLLFTNRKVEALVDALLADSKTPPVIIIQGDHGPASTLADPSGSAWKHPTRVNVRERMRILNAYYFPPGRSGALYPTISPVNSFRVVFNAFFAAALPLLPDRSYFSSYERISAFSDVTDVLGSDRG